MWNGNRKGGYFVADCKVDGQEKDVWFNNQAEWQLTETELLWNNLPGTVQTSFSASEYAGWKIEEIVLLEYPVVLCSLSLKLKREMQSINCSIRKKAACCRQKM